jgi:hypothetical protein
MNDFDYFNAVLMKLYDGCMDKSIVLTEDNVHPTDHFLLLGEFAHESITITFKNHRGIIYVYFDCDEPMRLEDCPTSFYRTLLKNM